MQTRLPKTKCVWPMKINVICTVRVSRPAGVLLLLVYSGVCPSQVLFQTYLSLGGECDGHVYGTSGRSGRLGHCKVY